MNEKYQYIATDAVIPSNCRLSNFIAVHSGAELGSGVKIGAMTTVEQGVVIGENSMIESHCCIAEGVRIGSNVRINFGTHVLSDVPDNAVVQGNPARIVGYTNTILKGNLTAFRNNPVQERVQLEVPGCFLEPVPNFSDVRGAISVLEEEKGVPFEPKRVFLVHGVGSEFTRGEHAHRECIQFLFAVSGSLSVLVDNGDKRQEVTLNSKRFGLLLPPMIWGIQYKFSHDCILMVLASHPYDEADYIRSYKEYLQLIR